jgi:hypothetical protein
MQLVFWPLRVSKESSSAAAFVQLGYAKLYKAGNSFDFMDLISLEGKTNFFEKKVSEYSKPGVGMDATQMVVRFDEEF